MIKSLFILPDGTRITSGPGSEIAVVEARLLRRANTAATMRCGSACAAELEAEFLDPTGKLSAVCAGPWTYLRDDGTAETQVGIFWPQSLTRISPNRVKLLAHDSMVLLDRDLTAWLEQLSPWPGTLKAMLEAVCQACGLELATGEFTNGDLPLRPFHRRATGRQLVQWIAEAAACFAGVSPGGALCLTNFTHAGELTLPVRQRSAREQPTEPIGSVEVVLEGGGTCRQGEESGTVYRIRNNPMLESMSEEQLAPATQRLAQQLAGISYTPGRLQVWDPQWQCRPGTFVTTVDPRGRRYDLGVFKVTHVGSTAILESAAAVPSTGEQTLDTLTRRTREAEAVLSRLQIALTALESTAGEHALSLVLQNNRDEDLTTEAAVSGAAQHREANALEDLFSRLAALESALGAAASMDDLARLAARLTVKTKDGAPVSLTLSGTDSGADLSLDGEALRWPARDPATALDTAGLQTRSLRCDALTLGRFTLRPTRTGLRLTKSG